ncbi:MAG: hypothetical protein ACPIOQ_29975 [Promethearchaeia archaeon]
MHAGIAAAVRENAVTIIVAPRTSASFASRSMQASMQRTSANTSDNLRTHRINL